VDVAAYPKGYLGLISANNRGQGISVGADFLQPVVEIGAMLAANNRGLSDYFNAALPLGQSSGNCFSVPAGEAWIVRAGGATLSLSGAGNTRMAHLLITNPEDNAQVVVSETGYVGPVVGAPLENRSIPWGYPGLLLASGTKIDFISTGSSASGAIRVTLLYDRLRA